MRSQGLGYHGPFPSPATLPTNSQCFGDLIIVSPVLWRALRVGPILVKAPGFQASSAPNATRLTGCVMRFQQQHLLTKSSEPSHAAEQRANGDTVSLHLVGRKRHAGMWGLGQGTKLLRLSNYSLKCWRWRLRSERGRLNPKAGIPPPSETPTTHSSFPGCKGRLCLPAASLGFPVIVLYKPIMFYMCRESMFKGICGSPSINYGLNRRTHL